MKKAGNIVLIAIASLLLVFAAACTPSEAELIDVEKETECPTITQGICLAFII